MKLQHNLGRHLLALTSLLLICAMLFASCNTGSGQPTDSSKPTQSSNTNDPSTPTDNTPTDKETNGGNDQNSDTSSYIDKSKISFTTDFSEGKALVRYGEMTSAEYKTVYCIDQSGKILFTLENIPLGASISGFYNGISTINTNDSGTLCFCDTTGKIIRPSDVGATAFLIDVEKYYDNTLSMFKAGYIFALNTTVSFDSSSSKVALLNSKLEIVSDYSENNYRLYEEWRYCDYNNGYLFDYDGDEIEAVFDLKNCQVIDDLDDFAASFRPAYASDMWYRDSYNRDKYSYYDSLHPDHAAKVDLSQYSETLYTMYDFENGLAPVVFKSAGKYFFALVKEDGKLSFEPVALSGTEPAIYGSNGQFVIKYVDNSSSTYHFEIYDATGKIAEMELMMTSNFPWFSFNDGVFVADLGKVVYYFNDKLEPLF